MEKVAMVKLGGAQDLAEAALGLVLATIVEIDICETIPQKSCWG
jgi:hypothetical protein